MSSLRVVYALDKEDIAHAMAVMGDRQPHAGFAPSSPPPPSQTQFTIKAIQEPAKVQFSDDDDDQHDDEDGGHHHHHHEEEEALGGVKELAPPSASSSPMPLPHHQPKSFTSRPRQLDSLSGKRMGPKPASTPAVVSSKIQMDADFPDAAPKRPTTQQQKQQRRAPCLPRCQASSASLSLRAFQPPTYLNGAAQPPPETSFRLSEKLHQQAKQTATKVQVVEASSGDSPPPNYSSTAPALSLVSSKDRRRGGGAGGVDHRDDDVEEERLSALLGTPVRTKMFRQVHSSSAKPSVHGNNVSVLEQYYRASKAKPQAILAEIASVENSRLPVLVVTTTELTHRDETFAVFRALMHGNEPVQCIVAFRQSEPESALLRSLGHMAHELGNEMVLTVHRPWKLITRGLQEGELPKLVCSGLVRVNSNM
ncbi:hypothetical protein BASA81_008397 [Batrachochytrium salamandrivorans]|nr:hypothetical protein BASA81_008397 [Batrachochytrium salamandrivorans]